MSFCRDGSAHCTYCTGCLLYIEIVACGIIVMENQLARRINRGNLYWLDETTETHVQHPCVVVQEDVFNHSRIHTVVVCSLTSNLKRAEYPGNLLLEAGEGGLPRQSVVEVSKISSVEKLRLGEYIGKLGDHRVDPNSQRVTAATTLFLRALNHEANHHGYMILMRQIMICSTRQAPQNRVAFSSTMGINNSYKNSMDSRCQLH